MRESSAQTAVQTENPGAERQRKNSELPLKGTSAERSRHKSAHGIMQIRPGEAWILQQIEELSAS